jgi:hypothetical protein
MWVSKIRLDKTKCLSLWGQKKPAGIKLQYFCQYGDKKKNKNKVHFISGVTHMENDLLFCSKLMFTNGNIVVCKYINK